MAWTGKYKNLSEIKNYDSYPVENHKFVNYEKSLVPRDDWDNNLLKILKNLNENIKLVDFGCTLSCRVYYMLMQNIGSKLEKYYGIDLPDMLKNCSADKHKNVILTDDMCTIKENISVFYSRSSIQYLQEPYKALHHVLSLSPKYFIIDDTPYTNEEEFITLQVTTPWMRSPDHPLPTHLYDSKWQFFVFNKEKLLSFFKKNGYKLTYSEYYKVDELNYNNLVFSKVEDI